MRRKGTLILVVLAAFAFGFAACGGGGGGGGSNSQDQDLILKKFLVVDKALKSLGGDGSTDVYRDARLYFEFNVAVDPASVSERTIRIGIPTGNNLYQNAVGRFETVTGRPNVIVFNPTYSDTNPGTTADNPLGFESDSRYEVLLFGPRDATVHVRNTFGDPIVQTFRFDFTTTNEYLPSLVQPEVLDHDPADGATGVGSRADIQIFFTEPMKPDSFVLGQTLFIRDELTGRSPLGTLRYSSDYRTVTFRPVFGYGKGIDNPDPNLAGVPISVQVTRSVTNLAGRPIPVAVSFSFRTAYDPTQPDFGDIRETFNTKTYEDTAFPNTFPLAAWNEASSPGMLRGVFTNGTWTRNNQNSYVTLEPWATGNVNTQWQTMYYAAEVGGTPRTITGYDWYKYCPSFATTAQNAQILMGHSKAGTLTTAFSANYSASPVTCVQPSSYSITTGTFVWYAGPAYTVNFPYNGSDNLILEIRHTASSAAGGATRGYAEWLGYGGPQNTGPIRSAMTPTAGTTTGPRTTNFVYDIRFAYLIDSSEARSDWYDTELESPQFLDAVVDSTVPAGTSYSLEFQGAPPVPLSAGTPDLGSTTQWTGILSNLSGYRFVRFGVSFQGNGTTNTQPLIEEIVFPYVYFE